ncbi:MAG: hypothetical protein WBR15_04825 [Gammaproteobacteria bacterium]
MGELNDNQKRYVLSVLSQVNHYLENIEELIHAKRTLLRDLQDDIVFVECTDLTAFIALMRAEILSIRDMFILKHISEAASARWGVSTNLEFASVELMELTKSKLTGYGPLDDKVFRDLKLQISRLQKMVSLQIKKFPPTKVGDGGG